MKKKFICLGLLLVIASIVMIGIFLKKEDTMLEENHPKNNSLAIYVKQEDGSYVKASSIPEEGYILNSEKSTCSNGVIPSWKDNSLKLSNLASKTSCYLYFDEACGEACKTILSGKTIDNSRANGITGVLTENTTGKIFKAQDDVGDTYFFAGAVDNNWVQFGGFYWRIIRVNGDGTIRMIYSGVANGNVSAANKTGRTTQISNNGETTKEYEFNAKYRDNTYVGYMYGASDQSGDDGYANTHRNTNSSTIKTHVDTWYNTNLNKAGIKEHIDTNAGFCGDRQVASGHSSYTGGGKGKGATVYAPADRVLTANLSNWKTTQIPAFKCDQSNDLYTVSEATKGNKALQYPAGLITSDEMVHAGGFGFTDNTSFYLYTNQVYWTMSPYRTESNGDARVFFVSASGHLENAYVANTYGIRPVINLRADTKLTGTGTETNPYKVV